MLQLRHFFDDRIMVLHIQNDLFQRMHRIEKRIFDLVLASLGILVSLPVWLAAALWIRTDSQGPVFFRPGADWAVRTYFSLL